MAAGTIRRRVPLRHHAPALHGINNYYKRARRLRGLRSRRRWRQLLRWMRDVPLIERKRRLKKLLGGSKGLSLQYGAFEGERCDCIEADGCALSQRAVEGVAQVEEPDERCGAPRARRGVALAGRSATIT